MCIDDVITIYVTYRKSKTHSDSNCTPKLTKIRIINLSRSTENKTSKESHVNFETKRKLDRPLR